MTYAKTQRGTHAHRTHSHTSYFTLEYIICIKHCSSFVKDENEYINYAQKGIIGYVYVTVSVCARPNRVHRSVSLRFISFTRCFDSIQVCLCHVYRNTKTHKRKRTLINAYAIARRNVGNGR